MNQELCPSPFSMNHEISSRPVSMNQEMCPRPESMNQELCTGLESMNQEEINGCIETSSDSNVYYVSNYANELKPFVGQKFPTQEDGVRFYKSYAAVCGFDIRLGATKKSIDGNCITWRYLYCNKEGEKHSAPVDIGERSEAFKKKKRRVSMRTGCQARMVMKFKGNHGYVVEYFIESHNHPLLSEAYKPFLNVNRKIDFIHQKFVLDCARASIGPMKSFRLFKEFVGAYSEVGCSSVDFKNVSHDMKAFVDGTDAQTVLNQMCRKKDLCSGYTFDYEVDADDRLIRLFWCDPISRRNYHLFGDVVSFDATYSTNRYCMIFAPFTGKDNHGKCVTFAAGLLSKEDAKSYVWLMEKFKKCMGAGPSIIVTDQDLGMKVAVERVLTGTRHRFCMWHIMLKVADKVPNHLKKDEEFKKKLCNVVWSEVIEPAEFEVGWNEIMNDFGLIGEKWFESMYDLRHFWIPAYFRDFPMSGLVKTTSISESENSFFGKYTRPRSNLVEFFMHFDSAIDAQRHANSHLNYLDESCNNKLESRILIAEHAATVYTSKIYRDVEKKILRACFYCRVLSIKGLAAGQEYQIDDGTENICCVIYNSVGNSAIYSCNLFSRIGLLCCHIFFLFKNLGFEAISDKYIVGHWMKKSILKPVHDISPDGEQFVAIDKNKILTSKLISQFYKCVGLVDGEPEKMSDLLRDIINLREKYNYGDDTLSCVPSKQSIFERFYGSAVPTEITIHPPNVVKTKGSGSRLQSRKETAIRQLNKPLRKCSKCKQMSNHDARNCPNDISINSEAGYNK